MYVTYDEGGMERDIQYFFLEGTNLLQHWMKSCDGETVCKRHM